MEAQYLSYFLPSEILSNFDIVSVEAKIDPSDNELALYIDLSQKNILPAGFSASDYESKGFYPSKQIQDFPIRGKAVYFNIKRRRWRHKSKPSEEIHTDFSFIAKDVKLTQELATFLKSTGHDPRRYG